MPRRSKSPSSKRHSTLIAEEFHEDAPGVVRWRVVNGALVEARSNAAQAAAPARKRSLTAAVAAVIRSVFLPAGYPDSVRPEYLRFQFFDTLQAACSYLRSILTTSAILRGAGVGEDKASPMAAAIAWVLRDGVGMFGSLVFSYFVGSKFDVDIKEWRLFADIINDVGMTLDLLAPLAGSSTGFAVVAALGAACKTICGMVAGATRASITAHFAIDGNLGDVSAKENAQETAVTLLGLLTGSALASALGDSALTAWATFVVLTAVHVWANVLGVGCLAFDFINPQRAVLLTRAWISTEAHTDRANRLSAPSISAQERFWRPLYLWHYGPRFGVGLKGLLAGLGGEAAALRLQLLQHVYADEQYLLSLDARGRPCVAFRANATGQTALKGYLNCALITAFFADAQNSSPNSSPNSSEFFADRVRAYGAAKVLAETLGQALAVTNKMWEPFSQAVGNEWTHAAVRLEHCAGNARVNVALAAHED